MENIETKSFQARQYFPKNRIVGYALLLFFFTCVFALGVYLLSVRGFVRYFHPLFTLRTEAYAIWYPQGDFSAQRESRIISQLTDLRKEHAAGMLSKMLTVQPDEMGIVIRKGDPVYFFRNPREEGKPADGFVKTRFGDKHYFLSEKISEQRETSFDLRHPKGVLAMITEQKPGLNSLFYLSRDRSGIFGVGYDKDAQSRFELGNAQTNFFPKLAQKELPAGSVSITAREKLPSLPIGLSNPEETRSLLFYDALWPGTWTISNDDAERTLNRPYHSTSSWKWEGKAGQANVLIEKILDDLTEQFPVSVPSILPDGDTIYELQRDRELFLNPGEDPLKSITYPHGQILADRKDNRVVLQKGSVAAEARTTGCNLPGAIVRGYVDGLSSLDSLWTNLSFSFRNDHFIACFPEEKD